MNIRVIQKLQCPYCDSPFKDIKAFEFFDSQKQNIQWGEVSCICESFPIVEGILYLKRDGFKNKISVSFLRERDFSKALSVLFEERRRAKVPYFFLLTLFQKSFTLPFPFFMVLLQGFIPESRLWFQHMLNRYKRPTFFLSLTSLSYFQKGSVIVDIGCSVNWFFSSFFKKWQKNTFIGVDFSWSALFLARKYFVNSKVDLICADINLGIPLKNAVADSITVNDTFMYIQKKKMIIQEFLRVGKKNIQVFLSHVHNEGAENVGQGYGLSPKEVKTYLPLFQVWATSDKKLFQSLQERNVHSYQKVKGNFFFEKNSASYSYLFVRHDTFFTPKKTLGWIEALARKTDFDYKEDRFL